MKKHFPVTILIVALATVAILNQGCSSVGELPTGMMWYKPGVSEEETKRDWFISQQQASQHTFSPTTVSQSHNSHDSSGTVQPNAYGLGVNADQYGRASTYQLQNGQQLDPIFNSGVKQNAYGPGVGQDQFGRAVYSAPSGNYNARSGNYGELGSRSDAGGQIALRLLTVMVENDNAKSYMKAKGYSLVKTNSPLLKTRQISNGSTTIDANSIAILKAKAESGDIQAQGKLADCYFLAEGVREDLAEAAKWYRKAAEQGDSRAQRCLGDDYWFGTGVPVDYAEARKWLSLAATQGQQSEAEKHLNIIKFLQDGNELSEFATRTEYPKLLGNWELIPSPGNHQKAVLFFLPKNRYKFVFSLTDSSGQSLPTTEENGRYYCYGLSLFLYNDKDKNGVAPYMAKATDTQLTLHLRQGRVNFQKQTQN